MSSSQFLSFAAFLVFQINLYLELQTTSSLWLFQLDDSKSLHWKWVFHQTSIYKWLALEFQIYIYIYIFSLYLQIYLKCLETQGISSLVPALISSNLFASTPHPRVHRPGKRESL